MTFLQSGARETLNYVDKCTDCALKPVILRAEQLDTSVHYVLQCTDCSFNWDGVCLLRGTNWFPKYNSYCNWSAMVQAVSHRPVVAEALVRSQYSPFVINGLHNNNGTGFSSSTSVFLLWISLYQCTIFDFIHMLCSNRRTNAKPGSLIQAE